MQITKFEITNYRSLIDFKADVFSSTTIFYGLNNAGKSNILSALNVIFKRKIQYDPNVDGGVTAPINFYTGLIPDFKINFFNQDDSLTIKFAIELQVRKNELEIGADIEPLIKKWPETLKFLIEGTIIKSSYGNGLAEIITNSIKLEDIVIYNPSNSAGYYFPTLLKKDPAKIGALSKAFTVMMDRFNDCVHIIRSERDMHQVRYSHKLTFDNIPLNPEMFKHFLHSLYLSEKKHHVFEEIDEMFSSEPFGFGKISFAKENDHLDVMIKEREIRLPIKALGSGVLQILYIITEIACHPNKIVCIEEIEQNLSPKLQNQALKKIQSLLGKKVDQIIISSHSSVFIAQGLSEAIYIIKKEGNKTVVDEVQTKTIGPKVKKHIVHATVVPGTYTDKADYEKYLTPEVKKAAEDRFND